MIISGPLVMRTPIVFWGLLMLATAGSAGCRDGWPGDFVFDAGFVEVGDAGFVDVGFVERPDIGFPYSFTDDVRPILVAKCHGCHGIPTANLAPRELFTYVDLTEVDPRSNRPVHELVALRINAADLRMPPPSTGIVLSATEIAILTTWSETGAPE